jgi:hypothetical protein
VLAIGELRPLDGTGRPPGAQPLARDGVARLRVVEQILRLPGEKLAIGPFGQGARPRASFV